MKLPKKIKAKWLKALRSGQYVQSRGTLHNPKTGGFCCLGLLQYCTLNGECEVFDTDNSKFKSMPSDNFWKTVGAEEVNRVGGEGHYRAYSAPSALAELNDTAKYSFAKIADWIETNVEAY